MKVNVRGHIIDLLAFKGLPNKRRKVFAKQPAQPIPVHPVNTLAQAIHPEKQRLTVAEIRDETRSSRTFRLIPDAAAGTKSLAPFRAGQYLSVKAEVNGARITRPYSISSAPYEALGANGFYEITIRKADPGFLTPFVWDNWAVGTKVITSGPLGFFYHDDLRDSRKIVGLAGGSGITPFRSMAREIVHGGLDAELLVLYGSSDEGDILFRDEFNDLAAKSGGKVRVVHVLSCAEVSLPGCEQGFITADVIRKYADVKAASFFVCGPQVMYRFLEGELTQLDLPRRRVRWEAFGEPKDPAALPGYPAGVAGRTFRMTVTIGGRTVEIPAAAGETVLVAMERANLAPPSQCRSGECGFCRSRLASGDVYVVPDGDGRRAADRKLGFIHPCSSYPLSDLELHVPSEA